MDKLQIWRQQIDGIDKQTLKLIRKRLVVVKKIGIWKKQHHLPALDKKRWQTAMQTRKVWANQLGLEQKFIADIFDLIHSQALKIEEKIKL